MLTTLKSDGKPQLSNVLHGVDDDGVIRISTTADRAKYANLRRTPWAALHVDGENFWSYAVIEGDVELSEVAADPHDAAVDELVEVYRALAGEHEDWDDYRASMVRDRRVVVRIRPTHAYGALRCSHPRSTRAASDARAGRYDGARHPWSAKAAVTAVRTSSTRSAGTRAIAEPPKPPPVIRAPTAPWAVAVSTTASSSAHEISKSSRIET